MRRLAEVATIGILLLGAPLATGCSGSAEKPAGSTPSDVESASTPTLYFEGTQWEWIDATIACYKEHGIDAYRGDENDYPTLSIPDADVTPEILFPIRDECEKEIGEPSPPTIDEEYVRATYRRLSDQYECLVEAGFAATRGPSEETYIDTWTSTGKMYSWDPMSEIDGPQFSSALAACPRLEPE